MGAVTSTYCLKIKFLTGAGVKDVSEQDEGNYLNLNVLPKNEEHECGGLDH